MPLPDYPINSLLDLEWRIPESEGFPQPRWSQNFRVRVVGPQEVYSGDGWSEGLSIFRWQQVTYVSGTAVDTRFGHLTDITPNTDRLRYLWISGSDENWDAGYGLQLSNRHPRYLERFPEGYIVPHTEYDLGQIRGVFEGLREEYGSLREGVFTSV